MAAAVANPNSFDAHNSFLSQGIKNCCKSSMKSAVKDKTECPVISSKLPEADLDPTIEVSPTVQAVCEMDIPRQLVKLALAIYQQKNNTFPSVTELYEAALEIANDPMKQVEKARELYNYEEQLKAAKEPKPEPILNNSKQISNGFTTPSPPPKEALPAVLPECSQSQATVSASPSVMNATSTRSELQSKVQALMVENRQLKDKKLCRACKKVELATSGITFLPCGHFITCEKCADSFDDCPACGKNIMGTVRTYLS